MGCHVLGGCRQECVVAQVAGGGGFVLDQGQGGAVGFRRTAAKFQEYAPADLLGFCLSDRARRR